MSFFQRPFNDRLPFRGVQDFQYEFTGQVNPISACVFPMDSSAAGQSPALLNDLISNILGYPAPGFASNLGSAEQATKTAQICYLLEQYENVRIRGIAIRTSLASFAGNQTVRIFSTMNKEMTFKEELAKNISGVGVDPTNFQTASVYLPVNVRMFPGSAISIDVRVNETITGSLEFSFGNVRD